MKLIFATNSPRRKELLKEFNIDVEFVSHLFNEDSMSRDKDPSSYCRAMADEKTSSLIHRYPKNPIISADTIVVSPNNKIFEKPKSKEEAFRMLSSLSGNKHSVLTGVDLKFPHQGINFNFIEKTLVEFNELEEEEIRYYIEKYNPLDKSGSYGIQDFSSIFVKSIEGCYFNVVGLPLSSLFFHLKKYKIVQFA
jgi:septum formation protein